MKLYLLALTLMTLVISCNKEENIKTYTPRILTKNEAFNDYLEKKTDSITIYKSNKKGKEDLLLVKFRDSIVSIQVDPNNSKKTTDNFTFAEFANTQKTCLLVQSADSIGPVAPSYLIALKDGKLDVISLYRPSTDASPKESGLGINRLGRTGHLVDNDFFITGVTARAYLLKRQNPEQRIQGKFLILSPDRKTIVFATPKSLYQVNYITDETSTENLPADLPQDITSVYQWVQNNYSFQKNRQGVSFLKSNDNDRIVDIKEFKK